MREKKRTETKDTTKLQEPALQINPSRIVFAWILWPNRSSDAMISVVGARYRDGDKSREGESDRWLGQYWTIRATGY
jgi:hypothetical protein